MYLTASEKATLHFYEWEYRGRGYYHFDDLVAIEPPYTPFRFKKFNDDTIDDGKVPNLFSSIKNIFSNKEKKCEPEDLVFVPNPSRATEKLKGFSISFEKGQVISSIISLEFINLLSFTNQSISFEIIGTHESIKIQFVCGLDDKKRICSHLEAYFPKITIKDISVFDIGFDTEKDIAIADFGLKDEFMRPIHTSTSFALDPLTSIIATLSNIEPGNIALLQILFKGVTAPWSRDIIHAVSDGRGGSFFIESPEMMTCAKEKISKPLFSVVMRIATQGNNRIESNYLATELARSMTTISSSPFNTLIPLSNEGYDYDNHKYNVYNRTSNRLGMILNSNELVSFVHYPNNTIVSEKLHQYYGKTKLLSQNCIQQKYLLGVNEHEEFQHNVTLNDTQRLQHCHIIGATGVGKSTLIANMMLQDMNIGNGCVLFDPHGDISNDVLLRVPQHRKDDVIIIDPSDTNFPIGFNLLHAKTDAEKIILSSDLVASFKRYATSWGDNMTAVLSNAINTFLESSTGGTLIELKRFLIEDTFRNTYLKNVDDQSILYYWKYEYPMVKKGIAPLLTRIDTFLRPKIIRYMFAQKNGIDFSEAIRTKKIIIIKLSLGLIGEENSYLLGSLFLSKLNQVAHARQSLAKNERHPYYIYLDEFHNFITPSIASMLSGARKYGIGLTLAHQELGQIDNTKILNSVISNPHIRICFRLGDNDAKKLENGFSYFEQSDLQSLDVGEAIMRVGSSTHDFNIKTYTLSKTEEQAEDIQHYIIQNTRNIYTKPKEEVRLLLDSLLARSIQEKVKPKNKETKRTDVETSVISKDTKAKNEKISQLKKDFELSKVKESTSDFEKQKEVYLEQAEEQETIRKHRALQNYVRAIALQRGFKVTFEQETNNGGRVDVALLKNDLRIAIEISVTNTVEYEVKNIQKCITDNFSLVYMISEDEKHLNTIKKLALKTIAKKYHSKIHFFKSEELSLYLDATEPKTKILEKRVRGYRVKVNYKTDTLDTGKQQSITNIIMKALRKK